MTIALFVPKVQFSVRRLYLGTIVAFASERVRALWEEPDTHAASGPAVEATCAGFQTQVCAWLSEAPLFALDDAVSAEHQGEWPVVPSHR
jgi:hypothetical protein